MSLALRMIVLALVVAGTNAGSATTAAGQGEVAPAVSGDSSGVLTGTLRDRDGDRPVPYGTVVLTESGRAAFADAAGGFRLTRLTPGPHRVRARQIGFAPVDTTILIDPAPAITTVEFRLRRVAIPLGRIAVVGHRSDRCTATGVPSADIDPRLAAVFAQLRENVDRLVLLLDQYPFRFSREERRVLHREPGPDVAERVDTVEYESRSRRPYHVGGIVYEDVDAAGTPTRYMYLPTFRDFADPAFLAAHCFTDAGIEHLPGDTSEVIRIDFLPASAIHQPDVEGSIYLDAHRYIVRRAIFRLTRPERVQPPVVSLTVTTTFRELAPLVPVFDSVTAVQPRPMAHVTSASVDSRGGQLTIGPAKTSGVTETAIETDRLLGHTFERGAPGDQPGGAQRPAPPAITALPGSADVAAVGPHLAGRVVGPDGAPLPGVTVELLGTADSVTTTDSGTFVLRDPPPGPGMLLVRRFGFRPERRAVTVSRSRFVPIEIALRSATHVLAPVTTTARERAAYREVGLDRRMREGIGQFVTYDQIVRRQAKRVTQLLETLRGLHLFSYTYPDPAVRVSGLRGKNECVGFMVDGMMQLALTAHDLDELVPVQNVGAIEFYRASELPAGWHAAAPAGDSLPKENEYLAGPTTARGPTVGPSAIMSQTCDVIAIWTRTRLGLATDGPPRDAPEARAAVRASVAFPGDSACEPRPADDSTTLVVYGLLQDGASPELVGAPAAALDRYRDSILAAVRRYFALPSDLTLHVLGYPFPSPDTMATGSDPRAHRRGADVAPALSGVAVFTLDSTGRMAGLRVAVTSLSGAADTSVLAAVQRAADAHAFPPFPGGGHGVPPVRFDLAITTTEPLPGDRAVPLASIDVPIWPLRRPAAIAPGPQPDIRPPAPAGPAVGSAEDSATLELVVNEHGQVIPTTVRGRADPGAAAGPDHHTFLTRLIQTLPQFRFDPALIGACPVPSLVTQGFGYHRVAGS